MSREMLRRARRRAAERGVSLAEYVRGLVANDLGDRTGSPDVRSIFGLFDSGGSDIGSQKDRMVDEAVEGLHRT